MPTLSNEHLCKLAQAGDTTARDILLKSNLGFIRKIALEQYRSMGLDENDIGIDVDDLVQEGSIGLLNAIPLFDAGRGHEISDLFGTGNPQCHDGLHPHLPRSV